MPNPTPATSIRKTPNFDFIFGRYSHSKCIIPYFQITMSFGDAANYLQLVNEMPGAASMEWKVEELFQRDIDWKRVQRKIVPYLKQTTEPQFFNSLTIALLPVRNKQITTFSDGKWTPPTLDRAEEFADSPRSFGPISCGFWAGWKGPEDESARIGQLCWNTNEICGIAIDGQHRLAAIKELQGTTIESTVPIILIVLDPDLGYSPNASRQSVIETLRALFIDLNKHAKIVSRARQILLDDRDPASVCVRELVGSELTNGSRELSANPPRIPLSLVDWHSEQAKFDEGPYLTTILGMDWAVAKVLSVRPFEDPMAFDEIDKLIGKLENKLEIDLSKARDRVGECRKYERPFAFVEEPTNELQLISDGFSRRWSYPVIELLSGLSPYRSLVDLRGSTGTLTPEFANWYSLKEAADTAAGVVKKAATLLTDYERELANRPEHPIAPSAFQGALDECKALKKSRPLAFTVVFQRALVLAFLQFSKVSTQMTDYLSGGDSEPDIETMVSDSEEGDEEFEEGALSGIQSLRARQLIDGINDFISKESEFLNTDYQFNWDDSKERSDRFWLCSLVHPEGPIDFSQAASKRAADILYLIALFYRYQRDAGWGDGDFEVLMERADNARTGIDLKLFQCLSRMWEGDTTIAGRILKSRDLDVQDSDKRWEEVRGRARWLWVRLAS